jgi:hypothetical protein
VAATTARQALCLPSVSLTRRKYTALRCHRLADIVPA